MSNNELKCISIQIKNSCTTREEVAEMSQELKEHVLPAVFPMFNLDIFTFKDGSQIIVQDDREGVAYYNTDKELISFPRPQKQPEKVVRICDYQEILIGEIVK